MPFYRGLEIRATYSSLKSMWKKINWGQKVIWGHFNPKILPLAVMFFARILFFLKRISRLLPLIRHCYFCFNPADTLSSKILLFFWKRFQVIFLENISTDLYSRKSPLEHFEKVDSFSMIFGKFSKFYQTISGFSIEQSAETQSGELQYRPKNPERYL